VLSHLLGNTMVVRDLAAARAVSAAGIQATLVTLGGELVRPAGSVTGGVAERSGGGVLAREREVRELPAQIAALEREVAQAQAALDRERLHGQQVATQVSVLEAQQHDLATRRVAQSAEEAARRQQAARVDQEVAWRESLRKQAETELAALDRREAEIGAGLAATQERQKAVQAQVEDLRKRLEGLDVSAAQAALAEARTEAAVGEQALRSQRAMLSNLEAGYARLLEQVAAKRDRATDLSNQNADLAARIETAQRRAELLSAELGELRLLIEPVEAAMALAQTQQAELSAQESAARPRLLQSERAATQAGMEVTRCQEDLAKLQAQIEAEESLRLPEGAGGAGADAAGTVVSDELPGMADFPHQLRLNLNGAGGRVLPLAAVQETPPTPEQIKRQVDRLRAQIRALGAINANAVAEYEETQKRFTFLSTQADDLQQASRSLKAVVAELDGVMKKRFTETFRAVAEEFKRYFSLLFNGGTARLALTDPDDPQMTGIDIVAQPPGKRMQSLALLSGGERALTATALLFSILTVNPTPFCVLDEVDAALDEANVGRFTQALKNLAQRTQFVVITHNRGTMEIASTLYGVSMGEDGASRLISLRLEEAEAQARKR
jgi:chromosome segregation protein